ncbi:Uncharacterised protein [Mycobacterium tuberculosis]|nr:Uncharacterised protein [Mycobacterium tuberculosis]
MIDCLVVLAGAPCDTTLRSHPSVYTAPADPRSRTVTYQGIRRASNGWSNRSLMTLQPA